MKLAIAFTTRQQGAYAKAGSVAEEVISCIRTVVAFGGEDKEAERHSNLSSVWISSQLHMSAYVFLRYKTELEHAKSEGKKKSVLLGSVLSTEYFMLYCIYGITFW